MRTRINLADAGKEGRHVSEPYGKIEVTLSRRNLLSLLHKLDWDGSARTIEKSEDGVILTVVAEDDTEHYGEHAAGVMHDETERFIESYGGSE
jgi:hypothetical protein